MVPALEDLNPSPCQTSAYWLLNVSVDPNCYEFRIDGMFFQVQFSCMIKCATLKADQDRWKVMMMI